MRTAKTSAKTTTEIMTKDEIEILNETILAEDISTGAVTTVEILNETILGEDIATGAVSTVEILDDTITSVDKASLLFFCSSSTAVSILVFAE